MQVMFNDAFPLHSHSGQTLHGELLKYLFVCLFFVAENYKERAFLVAVVQYRKRY